MDDAPEDYEVLDNIARNDVYVLEKKGRAYGSSWKKRGGCGAFMMLARKWDRIENQMKEKKYDIFDVDPEEKDGLLDDIQDLRRYLLLVEGEILAQAKTPIPGMAKTSDT